MFTERPGARASWLLLPLLLAACGGAGETVRTCATDAECGAGALCVQSACVTNRPPVVTLALPPSPTTNRVLFLDATATDPDAGDVITAHRWTIRAVGAACDAEPEPTTGARLELVFWCPGTYEVSVVAEDGRGGVSAPATQTVDVAAATGAPVVTVGPELAVDHACGGTPLACRPASAGAPVGIPLTAVVDDPAGGARTVRWRMVPPAGVDPAVKVTYAQGDASLTTEAWVEAATGPIAGVWHFRLRVTSAAGLLGRGDQAVRIGNRPPVLDPQPFRIDHRYEAGAYLAGGSLTLAATDPDGDPLSLTATLEEAGTDGCVSHLGPVTGGAVSFDTRCTEATRLIGPISRTIHVIAADGNGGAVDAAFPVEIGDRAPVVRLTSNPNGGVISLDHAFGACPHSAGSCYLAAGTASFEAIDPDGDPVTGPVVTATVAPGLLASNGEATTATGLTTFGFATTAGSPGEFRSAGGTTHFTLVATSADPFGTAGTLEVPVAIGNRPPVLVRATATTAVGHRYDPARKAYVSSATLAAFEDPDGDPLINAGSVGDASCHGFNVVAGEVDVACSLAYTMAAGLPTLASFTGDHAVVARVSDGWESVASATIVNIQDGPPTATPYAGTVESCFCACSKWSPDGTTCVGSGKWVADQASVPLPVVAGDADGDPVQVTYSSPTASGTQKTVWPGSCGDTLVRPTLPLTVQVTIDDGLSRVQTASTVMGVTCATAGQACTP